MESKDLFELIFGLIWLTGMLILWNRYKSNPKMWPRFFGVGGSAFAVILMMIESILFWPKSDFLRNTIAGFLLALAFGIMGYFSGRKLARMHDKQ
jgi:hypothetical protein